MSEEIERVIDEVLDRTLHFGDTDALGTFAEFHEQPILTFRNGSHISINRCAYSADVIRCAIARAENFDGTYTWDLDDWGEVKDVREVCARETNFSTQKLDEFLDEM